MAPSQRTHQEWFEEAARCYVDNHQGCCWCGGANRVYRSERGGRLEYECGECEFYASREDGDGRYFMAPGTSRGSKPASKTMHAVG